MIMPPHRPWFAQIRCWFRALQPIPQPRQTRRWLYAGVSGAVLALVLVTAPGLSDPALKLTAPQTRPSLTAQASTQTPAFQAQVQPTNPQLGDTLSVVVQLSGGASASQPPVQPSAQPAVQPTVTMGQKNYPLFDLGNGRYRALLPTTPLNTPGRISLQVSAGGQTQTLAVQLRDRDFPTQSIWLGEGGGPEGTDYEFDKVDAFKALVTPEKFWSGPFLRPSQGEVSTIYGVQRYYNGEFARDYYHRGVDYAAATGSPVVAPAAGRIALVGRVADGFTLHGNTIGIDHGQGVLSIMIHLSQIDVKEGDMVRAGQRIGAVGSTGISTGPHLHWGLYVNGESVDPVPWRTQGFD